MLTVTDWVFGIISDQNLVKQETRMRLGENLAAQVTVLIEAGDDRALGKTLQRLVVQNADMLSVAVRQASGIILAQRGDHAQHWVAPETGRSTVDHLRVPLLANRVHWGDIEISFAPAGPQNFQDMLRQPYVLLLGIMGVGGFLLYYAYLRRAMQYLDPSTAVPERVNKAFDSLTDALIVLDPEGRIVLANQAFRHLHGEGKDDLVGRKATELEWLQPALSSLGPMAVPWERSLREQATISDVRMTIPGPQEGAAVELAVGCSPVTDENGRTRGCLVTFDDLSELERANKELRLALAEIEQSRTLIKVQNEKLTQLASRDPLTGCYNRRAFFEKVTDLFDAALKSNGNLSCIMADIDHFKRFNDLYGHAVGDQVIRVVARTLEGHIRADDVLCRYGGEEFCLVLPEATAEQGAAIAERIRAGIEANAGSSVRSTDVGKITSSFGIASITEGASSIEQLIDQADNALYASKEGGRNRVTLWQQR